MVHLLFWRRRRRRRRRSGRARKARWLATGFVIGATLALCLHTGALPLGHPLLVAAWEVWSTLATGRPAARPAPRAGHAKAAAAPPAGARTVGLAHAVDGDTVELNTGLRRIRVRLRALHAPELADPGGRAAHRAMRRLASRGPFTCVASGRLTHGRTVADCRTAGGKDVATALIRAGVAAHCERYGRPDLARLAQPRRIWAKRPAYCRS